MPNKNQPRKAFNSELLNDLAESIKINGILQPIAVREVDNNKYEIIAGERRWRAAQIAGLTKVPIILFEANNEKTFELAIMENVQREDLNPIEEALAITLDGYFLHVSTPKSIIQIERFLNISKKYLNEKNYIL